MDKELELLNLEIEKTKNNLSDMATGISMLGVFFLAVIPLFYSIVGIYGFTVRDIQFPLILSIGIVFMATILCVWNWEINTKKLKGLYDKKEEMIKNHQEKQELTVEKTKKKR
jgi:hypothetical protein